MATHLWATIDSLILCFVIHASIFSYVQWLLSSVPRIIFPSLPVLLCLLETLEHHHLFLRLCLLLHIGQISSHSPKANLSRFLNLKKSKILFVRLSLSILDKYPQNCNVLFSINSTTFSVCWYNLLGLSLIPHFSFLCSESFWEFSYLSFWWHWAHLFQLCQMFLPHQIFGLDDSVFMLKSSLNDTITFLIGLSILHHVIDLFRFSSPDL